MLNNEYCKRVYEQILARDPDQKEFHQQLLRMVIFYLHQIHLQAVIQVR